MMNKLNRNKMRSFFWDFVVLDIDNVHDQNILNKKGYHSEYIENHCVMATEFLDGFESGLNRKLEEYTFMSYGISVKNVG